MIDWKSKLTSRKFWLALAQFVSMLILFFHGTQETATQVTSLIMAGAAVVAYIIGEGLADAAGAKAGIYADTLSQYLEDDDEPDPDADIEEEN